MQVRIDNKAKSAKYFFDSLPEAQRWIEETPRTWRDDTSESYGSYKSWDLNTDYKASLALARDGWNEGAAKVGVALKSLAIKTPAPTSKYDVVGHRVSVGRLVAGMPRHMVRRVTNANMGAGAVVTLVVPINANSGTDAKCMSNFGIAVMHHVRQLEMQKVRVEIIVSVVEKLMSDNTRLSVAIRVKQPDQPLNLSVLSFAIGHPAMFRRIVFGIMERTETKTCSVYGIPVPTRPNDVINMKPGTVILNGMTDANKIARTPEDALKYVEETVTAGLKGVAA